MSHTSAERSAARDDRRTPAQWYCLIVGLVLLLVGAFGFVSDSHFDTGEGVDGDLFLGFEVNGIHNLIHVASGLVLLAASPRRASARAVALAFFPVNPADNVLHIALSALGIVTALVSRDDDRGRSALDRGAGDRLRRDTATTPRQRAGH
jgi:hypothetical protein